MARDTRQILVDLDETLATAKLGLDTLLYGSANLQSAGLRNLVVFGRAVTNVLQNLRSTEPDFDDWYQPFVKEMREDPLLKYFYRLRSEILKEGKLPPPSGDIFIHRLTFPQDLDRVGPPPPGARGFFIGDEIGGIGWEVELDDGSIAKYYIDLPNEIATIKRRLPDAPREHLGKPLADNSFENLGSLYYSWIAKLVEQTHIRFGQN